MRRVLGVTLSLLVMTLGLVACGDGGGSDGPQEDESDKVRELQDDVGAAREGVVRAIVDATRVGFVGGKRRFRWCGESYAPRGIVLDEHLRFGPSPRGQQETLDTVSRVLEEQGWTVERPDNPAMVLGSRGIVQVRVEVGAAAFQVDIGNPECLTTSDDVARDFADRRSEDVVWEEGGS